MEAVIRGALVPRGYELMQVSRPLEVMKVLVALPEVDFIVAASEPSGCPDPVNLLLESRPDAPILLVLSGTCSRRMLPLLSRTAATLQWPFFPSDLIGAIKCLHTHEAMRRF
jgi:hypothetical protein